MVTSGRAGGHVVAEAYGTLAHDPGERRSHHRPVQPDLQQLELRGGAPRRGLGPLQLGLARGLLPEQVAGPGERLLGQVALRLGPGDLRLELGVVDLEERRAPATSAPSRTRIAAMRPSMSGRSSTDCRASISPVEMMASTTVSARATTTSTGIGGGAGCPPPPGAPPRIVLLASGAVAAEGEGQRGCE